MGIIEEDVPSSATAIGRCGVCSTPLPLRLPELHEQAREWTCTQCGSPYRGVLLESWPARYRHNVRPVVADRGRGLRDAKPAAASRTDFEPPPQISIAFPARGGVRSALETALSREFDAAIAQGAGLRLSPQGTPFAQCVRKHGDRPYDPAGVERFRESAGRSALQAAELFGSLSGRSVPMHLAASVSQEGLQQVAEDKDLFVNLGLTLPSNGYPSQHALRVGMLAMSIGATLGWDERTLLDLGIGCLVHDIGMLGLAPETYQRNRILSAAEFAVVAEHPVRLFELLQRHADEISEAARLVAYQIHERCDGSGYPRGYQRDQIHALAKVAAVADVFVALVSPRPHRPGMVPYHAMKKVLQDTKRGAFDGAAVRGLLETVSLFPIGSFVALNDGRVGRVIRAGEGKYDRPVVEAWNRSDLAGAPAVIALAEQQDLRVVNSLVRLDD